MRRFFEILARYIAAIFVAFVVSVGAFLFVLTPIQIFLESRGMSASMHKCAFFISLALIGFSGVFAGSLCLERDSRRLGSIVLLVVGLFYHFCLECLGMDAVNPQILPPLVSLAIGGLGAVLLAFRRWPSNPKSQPPEDVKDVQPG